MSALEQRRLRDAYNGLQAETAADIHDAIAALQSTDTPGMEALEEQLWKRYRELQAKEAKEKKAGKKRAPVKHGTFKLPGSKANGMPFVTKKKGCIDLIDKTAVEAAAARLQKVVNRNTGNTNLMGVKVLDLHRVLQAFYGLNVVERGTDAYFAEGTAMRKQYEPEVSLRSVLSKKLGFSETQSDITLLKSVRAREEERELLVPPALGRHQLKFAGDIVGRQADAMQKKGANRRDHYALNQLAHWLWRLAEYYR